MSTGFETHDHRHCIKGGLHDLERHCAENGLKLTPVRRRVFELLLEGHKAMGAYDLLDHLRKDGLGSQPPVVYRALEFLTQHRFAHKIEGLNAFVACTSPGAAHDPAFMICRKCDRVAEAQTTPSSLDQMAASAGFAIEQKTVEVVGVCPDCSPKVDVQP